MANLMEAKARLVYEIAKTQRLAWSCALFVGLFLVLVGHVPFLPVFAGCILGVAVTALKAWPHPKPKSVVRGGR